MSFSQDYTPKGLKLEGAFENDRNANSRDTFKAVLHEAFGIVDCIIAHHLVYVRVENRDGFDFQVIEEIPSADALLFDHDIARIIWGDAWQRVLTKLALEPVETRDALFCKLYHERTIDHAGSV